MEVSSAAAPPPMNTNGSIIGDRHPGF